MPNNETEEHTCYICGLTYTGWWSAACANCGGVVCQDHVVAGRVPGDEHSCTNPECIEVVERNRQLRNATMAELFKDDLPSTTTIR
jgi:hypothetical protein